LSPKQPNCLETLHAKVTYTTNKEMFGYKAQCATAPSAYVVRGTKY